MIIDVRVPAIERYFDTAHAGLDEVESSQTGPSETAVAVGLSFRSGVPTDIKGGELPRIHHLPGSLARGVVECSLGLDINDSPSSE